MCQLSPRLKLTRIAIGFVTLAVCVGWLLSRDSTDHVRAQTGVNYKNFEGPQVHPLAMTPDGTRLLAVNTPAATLSVFQLVSGSPILTAWRKPSSISGERNTFPDDATKRTLDDAIASMPVTGP